MNRNNKKKLLILIVASMMITFSCKTRSTYPTGKQCTGLSQEQSNKDNVVTFIESEYSAPLFHFGSQITEDIIYIVEPNGKDIKSFTIKGSSCKLQIIGHNEEPVTELEVYIDDEKNYDSESNQLKFKLKVPKDAVVDEESIYVNYKILTTFEDDVTETTILQFEIRKNPEIIFSRGTPDQVDGNASDSSIGLANGNEIGSITSEDGTLCQTIITINKDKFLTVTGVEDQKGAVADYTIDQIVIKSSDVSKIGVNSKTPVTDNNKLVVTSNKYIGTLTASIDYNKITDYSAIDGMFYFKLSKVDNGISRITPSIHLTYVDPISNEIVKLIVKGAVTRVKGANQ